MLSVIGGVCAVRFAVYAVVWTLTGKHVWLIPNLWSDEVAIVDILNPWIAEEKDKDGKPYPAPHYTHRAAAIFGLVTMVYAVYANTPEKGYGAKIKKYNEDALDFLVAHASFGRIEGKTLADEPAPPPAPSPEPAAPHTAGAGAGSGAGESGGEGKTEL